MAGEFVGRFDANVEDFSGSHETRSFLRVLIGDGSTRVEEGRCRAAKRLTPISVAQGAVTRHIPWCSVLMMTLEFVLGPMLWMLLGSTVVATLVVIVVAVLKRGWAFAVLASALPFFAASACAALELHYLDEAIAEEGGALGTVAPAIARALMLAMLGFAATLIPAIPAAMSAPRGPLWRWPLVPLFLIPVVAIAQLPFGYPATSLIRLIGYVGIAGALAKRGTSLAIMLPVVASGESAAIAAAYVDLFSSLAMNSVPGIDMLSSTAREIAAGRWFALASFVSLIAAQLIAKHWKSLLLLAPFCLLFAWIGDPTEQIVSLVR